MKIKNNTLSQIASALCGAQNVAIFCHIRPDGDALGSGLALYAALQAAGKQVSMLCEDEPPQKLNFLPHMDKVQTQLPADIVYDTFVSVDCADISRIGSRLGSAFYHFTGNTVNIDHHVSNTGFGKFNYVVDCTATCQLMPEILQACGYEITQDIANLLMVGLLTDSGNFAHSDVCSKTFEVAALLKDRGADLTKANYLLFKVQTKARARLFGRVVNKLRFFHEDKIAIVSIMQQDLLSCEANDSLTEGIVDFPLSIEGVEVAASVMEVKQGQYKISFRSNGKANVNAAAAQFGGGGHILASGCMLYGEYEEVIERIVYAIYQQL